MYTLQVLQNRVNELTAQREEDEVIILIDIN